MESAQIAAGSVPEIEIRPPRRWGELRLRELWEFRELLYFLFKRELQVRYKQSFLGVLWAVLQPIGLAALFTLVFSVLLNVQTDTGTPYVVFALAGLVPWSLNAQGVNLCSNSLVQDAGLLSKVYFPRLAIPLAKVLALLFDFLIAFTVLLVITLAYGIPLSPALLLIPAFVLLTVVTTFGVGCFLAAANVRYRDVAIATPLLVQVWLFMSPIIYPSSAVTGNAQYAYALNPMATVIDGFRWALFGQPTPNLALVAISVGSALFVFTVGLLYFRRAEQFFADII